MLIRLDQEQKNESRCNYPEATLLLGDILKFQIGLENARYQDYTFIATISIMYINNLWVPLLYLMSFIYVFIISRSGEKKDLGTMLGADQDYDFLHCILLRHFA